VVRKAQTPRDEQKKVRFDIKEGLAQMIKDSNLDIDKVEESSFSVAPKKNRS